MMDDRPLAIDDDAAQAARYSGHTARLDGMPRKAPECYGSYARSWEAGWDQAAAQFEAEVSQAGAFGRTAPEHVAKGWVAGIGAARGGVAPGMVPDAPLGWTEAYIQAFTGERIIMAMEANSGRRDVETQSSAVPDDGQTEFDRITFDAPAKAGFEVWSTHKNSLYSEKPDDWLGTQQRTKKLWKNIADAVLAAHLLAQEGR